MLPLDFAKSMDLIYCIQIEGTFHDAIEKNVKIMKEVETKLFEEDQESNTERKNKKEKRN